METKRKEPGAMSGITLVPDRKLEKRAGGS